MKNNLGYCVFCIGGSYNVKTIVKAGVITDSDFIKIDNGITGLIQ
jgi:hypothetical protein